MTTRTGCTQTLLSSDYIFFFHQRNRVFDCLLFGQAALVFSEFIFNRMRPKKKEKKEKKIAAGGAARGAGLQCVRPLRHAGAGGAVHAPRVGAIHPADAAAPQP